MKRLVLLGALVVCGAFTSASAMASAAKASAAAQPVDVASGVIIVPTPPKGGGGIQLSPLLADGNYTFPTTPKAVPWWWGWWG